MSFEEYYVDDLFTPSLLDGGAIPFEQHPASPDFILTDSFADPLFPHSQSKTTKNDFSEQHDDVIPDLDLSDIDLDNLPGKTPRCSARVEHRSSSDLFQDDQSFDIGTYISAMSFPSPIESSEYSPSSNDGSLIDDSPLTIESSPSSTSSMVAKRSKLNPMERKLRKKKQNKNAAEKYRIKKKSERDQLIDRHTQLKTLNQNLRLEFESLSDRVQQLKQLLSLIHI